MAYYNQLIAYLHSNWDRFSQSWLWSAVFFPFLTTRFALIVVAFGSEFFVNYPGINPGEIVQRGWWFTGNKLLDMWARWDSGWYLNIVEHGYYINGDLATSQSNIVFYPLYPILVKAFSSVIPSSWINTKVYLAVGVLLSNLFLILGLILLYKLVCEFMSGPIIAEKSIIYLLVFPTSFFFSTFYSESVFLFFNIATVYACLHKRWWLAGLCSGLLALARPTGVLIIILTGWLYMDSIEWKFSRLRPNVLWLGLAPLSWLAFQLYTSNIAGVLGASILNQQSWNRNFDFNLFSYLLGVLQDPVPFHKFTMIFALIFLILSVISFWRLPSKGYAFFSFFQIVVPYVSGRDISLMRFLLGVFPVYILTAQLVVNRPRLDVFIRTILFALQMVYMAAWFNLYPIA